jgi:hypothetical protein
MDLKYGISVLASLNIGLFFVLYIIQFVSAKRNAERLDVIENLLEEILNKNKE